MLYFLISTISFTLHPQGGSDLGYQGHAVRRQDLSPCLWAGVCLSSAGEQEAAANQYIQRLQARGIRLGHARDLRRLQRQDKDIQLSSHGTRSSDQRYP